MIWMLAGTAVFLVLLIVGLILVDGRRMRRMGGSASSSTPSTCADCTHFDLEEGQAVMRNYPVFMKAAAVVSPAEIGKTILRYEQQPCTEIVGSNGHTGCEVCDGKTYIEEPIFTPPSAPYKARWDQMGACMSEARAASGVEPAVIWSGGLDCKGEFFQLRKK